MAYERSSNWCHAQSTWHSRHGYFGANRAKLCNADGNEDNARVAAEGWVTEAQTKAGACQIVQQRRRGYTRNILAVEAEGFDDGIAQGLGIRLHGLPDDGFPALKSSKNK